MKKKFNPNEYKGTTQGLLGTLNKQQKTFPPTSSPSQSVLFSSKALQWFQTDRPPLSDEYVQELFGVCSGV